MTGKYPLIFFTFSTMSHFSKSIIALLTLVLALPASYAVGVNYPSSAPTGETDGGIFFQFFKNMYQNSNPCGNSGAVIGFQYNGNAYDSTNGITICGYPLASGFTGALLGTDNAIPKWTNQGKEFTSSLLGDDGNRVTLGTRPDPLVEPLSAFLNDTDTQKALIIQGNNSSGRPTVLIQDDLRVA